MLWEDKREDNQGWNQGLDRAMRIGVGEEEQSMAGPRRDIRDAGRARGVAVLEVKDG